MTTDVSYGRAESIRRLRALLKTRTLITLVGPGGIGKTWLARAVLAAHQADGGEGWFCTAERARSDADLIEAIETAVGSNTPGLSDVETRFERVLTHLTDRPGLLVIDNIEQLPDPAHRVGQLRAAGVVVMLTSRHRFHTEGEQIFPVTGLGSAARALFMTRARIVDPTFDEAQPGLDALLDRLDGVPLAIELAAGRMGSFTPQDILDRLNAGLTERHRPDRPARQMSIERSHTWSWDMCAPDLQAVLGRCTVFEGGFDLDAAEGVLGADAIEQIQRMVDRSLLRVDRSSGATRFAMRQLWRDFVAHRVSPAIKAQAAAAHRDWYIAAGLRAAAEAHGPNGAAARRWLRAEQANLGALADTGVWQAVWASRALLHYGGLPLRYPTWVGQCVGPVADLLRGELALQQGRLTAAMTALDAARDAVDEEWRWEVVLYLGIAYVEKGAIHESMALHTAALDAARAADSVRGIGRALGSQGVTLRLLGDLNAAQDRYDQAFDALRDAGDTLSLAILTLQIGDIHVQAGRLTEARLAYTSAYDQFRTLDSLRWMGFTSGKLGAIALEDGDAAVALERCQDAVDRLTRAGCVREAGVFNGYVGVARQAAGDAEGALAQYIDAQAQIRTDRRHCAIFASFAAVAAAQLDQTFDYWLDTADALAADIPGVQLTLKLNRAHAQARIDPLYADAVLAEAVEEAVGTDARIARRWLAMALGKEEHNTAPDALCVWPDFDRFEPPGASVVDISRRHTLMRIFKALVLARREEPGVGLSIEELQEQGWPGERMSAVSGANRIYVAVATLRSNGLRDLLLKREVGYLLDPATPLVIRPRG